MATLSAEAIAGYGFGAGWRGEALVTAVAIALAESSGDPAARGDRNLTESGEVSIGLWQINYRPSRDKLGGPRDPTLNLDPATNAKNAYGISSGGTKWSPWSTYTNGAYKTHVTAARAGAGTVEQRGGAGTQTASTASASSTSSASYGPRTPDVISRPEAWGGTSGAWSIEVGGKSIAQLIGERLLTADVDLSWDAVPELTFEVHVEPGKINRYVEHFLEGVEVGYGELRFVIAATEVSPAEAGVRFLATCRSRGLHFMRKDYDAAAYTNRSPTQVAETLARKHRMGFVGEGSATRPNIARTEADPTPSSNASAKKRKGESAFDLLTRLADELGYVLFDAGNTLHFGRPSWLKTKGVEFDAHYKYRLGYDMLGVPTIRRTADAGPDNSERQTVIEFELPYRQGRLVRPGQRLNFEGFASYRGTYLVTSVRWSPTDTAGTVSITAETPIDPDPNPPEGVFGASASSSSPATAVNAAAQNGKASSLDFVTVALAQVGDSYVYGAEVRLDDDDPDTFDCSELVQWACARVGVTIPDGSENQRAATNPISVEQAGRTRGALLFHPGHVAISLGDGANTVEAMGRKYGVVKGKIAGRFTTAGLIKGMSYGGTSTSSGGGAIAVVD